MSGVEEGGGEPSSGSTPDKKAAISYSPNQPCVTYNRFTLRESAITSPGDLMQFRVESNRKFFQRGAERRRDLTHHFDEEIVR
jgi:hypothetical protein